MNVTIEHPFCPYCSEVTNLYFRIINTLLFSKDENELRTSMESLKKETRLDGECKLNCVKFSFVVLE